MPAKNIFAGFEARSEFVNLIYTELMKREFVSYADILALASMVSACHQKEVEKDIKLKGRTWMYLRVEFPSELTWAIDPLLQYVLNYQPSFLVFAGE